MSIFVNAPFVAINKLGVLGIATFFFLNFWVDSTVARSQFQHENGGQTYV